LLKVRVVDQQLQQRRQNVEETPQVNATPAAGNKI